MGPLTHLMLTVNDLPQSIRYIIYHSDLKIGERKGVCLCLGKYALKASRNNLHWVMQAMHSVELSPIHDPAELQPRFSLEPLLHTKLADVPFSIPAALSLHTSNGTALCRGITGCSELKPSIRTGRGFCTPY